MGTGERTWTVYVADVAEDSTSVAAVAVGETSISPSWSPDGTRLVFAENHGQTATIRVVNRDGTGMVELPGTGGYISHVAWHPDGPEILVAGAGGLWIISPDGEVLHDVFRPGDHSPGIGWGSSDIAWSPDGSRFAVRGGISFVLATASREGDDWRILAVGGGEREFRLCNLPAQGPEYPSHSDIEQHCEQSP